MGLDTFNNHFHRAINSAERKNHMIVDRFENIRFYEKLLPNLSAGLAKIKELGSSEVGRHEFDGGYLVITRDGATHPMEKGTFEVHRKYIDVHIILEGCEEMAWKPLSELTPSIPYDPQNDIEFLDGEKDHVLFAEAGLFYAVYPEDGHIPASHTKEQHPFTKIVVKLPVEE